MLVTELCAWNYEKLRAVIGKNNPALGRALADEAVSLFLYGV
jgi:hypothetical protein